MTSAPSLPVTLTAWTQHAYGGPDAVASEEVPLPAPGADEVILRVRATALNAADVHVMRGDPRLVRLFFGLRAPKETVRGMDVAGTVVAVGPGVTAFAVGDEVVGQLPGGGLAPYAVARVRQIVERPPEVSPQDAATLPIAGGTAFAALRGVGAGDRVLVLGASGGVGHFAVQLAAGRGARVTASCGARSREFVEGLGAEQVLDYRTLDYADPASAGLAPASFDRVVVIAGPTPLRALRRLVRPGGRIVLVSGDGGPVLGPIPRMLSAALLSLTPGPKVASLTVAADPEVVRALLALAADGALTPSIERTFPLSRAREALSHLDSGRAVGKTVVVPD